MAKKNERLLGAHMSIAGGYYKAADAAGLLEMTTFQCFTKSNAQWRAKPIADEEAEQFRTQVAAHGLERPISHSSYLINLASPDKELRDKSVSALVVELERCETLGIERLVLHPGAFVDSSEEQGLLNVVRSLDRVHRQTSGAARVLLENTAGQGSCLGWKLEHLSHIVGRAKEPERLGVCLDTCHLLAAGYGLTAAADYEETMEEVRATVGCERVEAFHINDSKTPRGSRKDRHEHIGHGEVGIDGFRRLLRDPTWKTTPMYLETPKGKTDDGEDWDAVNLRTLRELL